MIQKDTQRTLADQLFYPEKQNIKTDTFPETMDSRNRAIVFKMSYWFN